MDTSNCQATQLAKELLDAIDILEEYNPRVFYEDQHVSLLRGKSYREQWETSTKKYWYHFLLKDGSLIVFEEDSYRYLMSPLAIPTIDDFIHEEFGDGWNEFSLDEQKDYLSSINFQVDLDNYRSSVADNRPYTPVRYDMSLSDNEYCKFTHPAFHLHLGFENNSRLPVKLKMTPFSFCTFILITFYPKQWHKGLTDQTIDEKFLTKLKNEKDTIVKIKSELWCNEFEESRYYLS